MRFESAWYRNITDAVQDAGICKFQKQQTRFLTGGERKAARPILDKRLASGLIRGPFATRQEAEICEVGDALVVEPKLSDEVNVELPLVVDQEAQALDGVTSTVEVPALEPVAEVVESVAAAVEPEVVDAVVEPTPAVEEAPAAVPEVIVAAEPVAAPEVAPPAAEEAPATPVATPMLVTGDGDDDDDDDGVVATVAVAATKSSKSSKSSKPKA